VADKFNMRRTRRALKIFDAGEAKRRAAWDRIGSSKGVRIAEAADRLALVKVQLAFAIDTYDRNSLDNCMRVGIDYLRKMAKIGE
jgi:hypothetical protein